MQGAEGEVSVGGTGDPVLTPPGCTQQAWLYPVGLAAPRSEGPRLTEDKGGSIPVGAAWRPPSREGGGRGPGGEPRGPGR